MSKTLGRWLIAGVVYLPAAGWCAPPVAQTAGATEPVASSYGWSLSGGLDHSDNIGRTPDNEESETTAQAALALNVDAQRPRIQSQISADVSYRDYLDNSFGNEFVGGLNGNVNFAVVPRRFLWTVQDNYGQVAKDSRAIETPDNRQNFNYFSTGPDFNFALGARTFLQLSGRGSDVRYETTEADNRRVSGSLGLNRQMSDQVSLGLNASNSHTEYRDALAGPDYDTRAAFLSLDAKGVFTTLSVDAGYTELKRTESHDGLLLRVDLSRKIGTRSTLAAQLGREFSSTADVFQQDQQFGGVRQGSVDATATSDPFQADYAYLSWNIVGERMTAKLSTNWRQETHEDQPLLDRDLVSAGIDLSRRLGQRTSVGVQGAYSHDSFAATLEDRKEVTVGGHFNWLLGRRVSMQLRVQQARGHGGVGDTRDYTENRGYLGLTYSRAP